MNVTGSPALPPGRRPSGEITRGTTNTNRLRRVDRWLARQARDLLRESADPLVVDLGFGASPTTTVELRDRLRPVRADVEVIGIEIDPQRVRRAQEWTERAAAAGRDVCGLGFAYGGFEVPLPQGRRPTIIRAFNVLRQYNRDEVQAVWAQLTSRLSSPGLVVEGTCDEIGRRATWVALSTCGPQTLTLATRLAGLEWPSELAERLPKILIHDNVPGQPVYDLFRQFDRAWERHRSLATFGAADRWLASVDQLRADGWPVQGRREKWRPGELTIDWSALVPGDGG